MIDVNENHDGYVKINEEEDINDEYDEWDYNHHRMITLI